MDSEQFVAAVVTESEALADAAATAGLDAPVPSCPDWTVADLLRHCITGDLWARTIVQRRTVERVTAELPNEVPTGDGLVPFFLEGARALADVLAATEPTVSVWTFSAADRTAHFWRRRRAHESAIHRFDAQLAAGAPGPIEVVLAADGIDEFLTVFATRFGKDSVAAGETLHLQCSDADDHWLVRGEGDGVVVTREDSDGDVAVRGSSSDLLLFLWGRLPVDCLEVLGDTARLARFRLASSV